MVGSETATAARWRNLRRGSFIVIPREVRWLDSALGRLVALTVRLDREYGSAAIFVTSAAAELGR